MPTPPQPLPQWHLNRYTVALEIDEVKRDDWQAIEHYTLLRHTIVQAGTGIPPTRKGDMAQALEIYLFGASYMTNAARTFICSGDAYEKIHGRTDHLTRVQQWEHYGRRYSIDLTTAVPPPPAGGPPWVLESYQTGIELDEVLPNVWESIDHHTMIRGRNETFTTSFKEAVGSVFGVSAFTGDKRTHAGQAMICTQDEITPAHDALPIVYRSQTWEAYGSRQAVEIEWKA